MTPQAGQSPAVGQMLPTSSVNAVDGTTVLLRPSPHRATILVFPHPGGCDRCQTYLGELGEQASGFSRWTATLVAIASDVGAAEQLADSISYRVAVDPTLRERCHIPGDAVAVLVVDRQGEIWERTMSDDHGALPTASDLEQDVRFIAIQCPECEVPDTPHLGEWADSSGVAE